VRTESLEVRVAASLHALSRVGLIVPRHRHSAVERNRVKRRLRELLRLEVLPVLSRVSPALDVVVRAGAPAYDRSYDELRSELRQVTRRIA
jgi:ribonuclease P protein component